MNDSASAVTSDGRSLILNGKRRLIISGEIHYARVPRAEWARVLDRSKEAGINCVASYVFWGVHEPREGVYDFSGNADLGAFIELCRERDMAFIVRMGPYICAEWNYGGFPAWLRDVPDIVIRTWNEPYVERVKKYFRMLVAHIRPHLATNGGNVVLVQVENEYNNISKRYGENGSRYLTWVVDYAKSLGIDVPTVTCEGGAPGAIDAMNGFSVHETAVRHRQKYPDMPLLWTENWPGWYDTWGYEHHLRDAYEIGYEVMRFIGTGGSGFNYYMWHGGTNFGRTSMYLATTSYDFDAPLSEQGEPTEKYRILAALHKSLLEHHDLLLEGERTEETLGTDAQTFSVSWRRQGEACVLTVNGADAPREISSGQGKALLHPAKSVCFWKARKGGSVVLWKSWADRSKTKKPKKPAPGWKTVVSGASWVTFPEPKPSERNDAITASEPIEQLLLTKDATDYCWYATEVESKSARKATLAIERGGDFFHILVNGKLVDWTRGRIDEIRGPSLPSNKATIIPANPLEESVLKSGKNGYRHAFTLPLKRGKNRIEILACALGLIKGDWQLAMSMQYERKGIWDVVSLDGKKMKGWRHHAGLIGEKLQLSHPLAAEVPVVKWQKAKQVAPMSWHLLEFELSARQLQASNVWAFDATGVEKGMLWLNGHGVGRVWQVPALGIGGDPVSPVISITGEGEPTQRYFRLPPSWLRAKNRLVFFSENGVKPSPKALVSRAYRAA